MVLLNGKKTSQTSINDRGLLYGQSVFETIAINNGQACLIDLHLKRLLMGCKALGIPLKLERLQLELNDFFEQLNDDELKKGVARLTVTMGEGGRGYLDPKSPQINRIISFHDYPNHPQSNWEQGIELGLSAVKLASQPLLAGIKHGNRLEQILARQSWEPHWQEALLLNYNNEVIEATQSNVFIVKDGILKTPELSECGVAGVMREYIIEHAQALGLEVKLVSLSVPECLSADELFVSNSILGIWPVKRFQETVFNQFNVSQTLLKSIIKNEVIPNF